MACGVMPKRRRAARHRRCGDAGVWRPGSRRATSSPIRAEPKPARKAASTPPPRPPLPPETIEHIAWTLLKRYGVVCWRMLEREASWLPPWRELLRVYHRLEARGEIRGGRFVAKATRAGDAVALLRKIRKQERTGELIAISGADPLNLIGSVVPRHRADRRAHPVSRRHSGRDARREVGQYAGRTAARRRVDVPQAAAARPFASGREAADRAAGSSGGTGRR